MSKLKLNKNSKISYVELYNFMAYKHAKAYFDERGILNIKGYNSSGKSAFDTAMAVCLMNAYVGKQGKFIRHGCDYFRVVVGFDDGVSIVKDKYVNGQSLYEMYLDEQLIFTTKQGNKLAKVGEIPSIIKEYVDLIETEIGYLNYQTCRDPLWLIDTKGSENYSTLNEVLKSEEISRANALLNSDVNQLNSEIASLESDIQVKELQLQACEGITEELIFVLEEKEKDNAQLDLRQKNIGEILVSNEDFQELKVGYSVDKVESNQLKVIQEIHNTVEEQESLVVPIKLDDVEVKRYDYILKLSVAYESYMKASENIGITVSNIEGTGRTEKLGRLVSDLKDYLKAVEELIKLKQEEDKLRLEKDSFIEDAKKEGKYFVECENCGTLMEVDTSGI